MFNIGDKKCLNAFCLQFNAAIKCSSSFLADIFKVQLNDTSITI